MFSFARFGNDLYTGRRSYDFVGNRRRWYAIAGGVVLLSLLLLGVRQLNPGIEFRGGSEFRVSGVTQSDTSVASDTVLGVVPGAGTPQVTTLGDDSVRVQTERLTDTETDEVAGGLAEAYGVDAGAVTSSFVGPSWGQDVTDKALRALVIFLVLVGLVIALYFRTWKMAAAALVALLHDLVVTVGIYAAVGFEVTPATVIGFLTILGYSLYDTVVVFDKVRENTEHVLVGTRRTYAEAANLAVNQTLVRSINTSVVATLPVAGILFIGAFLLGAGTLKDIALALFIGIIAGTYSSVFLATPLLVHFREREPAIVAQAERVQARRRADARKATDAPPGAATASGATALAGAGPATAVLERDDAEPGDPPADPGADPPAGSDASPGGRRGPRNQPPRNQPRRDRGGRPGGSRRKRR